MKGDAMTRLIIARHGNTFAAGEEPRRVGKRTDLNLVDKGVEQAVHIGRYLKAQDIIPDAVYTSHLKRTKQTARYALEEAGLSIETQPLDMFDEIDYGPDENQPECDVVARIGQDAMRCWSEEGIVPPGWNAEPERIITDIQDFAHRICDEFPDGTVMAVTSGGISRFIPHLTGDFAGFREIYSPKVSTGSISILEHIDDKGWEIVKWNYCPSSE